jgi:hypothetical protein
MSSLATLKADKMSRNLGTLALGGAAAGEINSSQGLAVAAGPTATVSVAAPAIVPRFAGQMKVSGGMTVTAATPGTIVTFTLQRGSTVIQQRRSTSGASGLANTSFDMIDPVLQTGSAVYSIVATPAAGNVSIATLEGNVTVVESGA